ncbi:MAG TPA: helix-turn-helix domain-containing protein [Clostridia bacterium]|nr:helix-turn-helix domain-containing protein [Clostridia bacterium]
MEQQEIGRQERVVNAAWEIFARFGYRKSSMQDIAEVAGVSKSVLFKYHGTKENLYRAVFWRATDEIAAADASAKAGRVEGETVFSAMRRTVDARMRLFARAPFVFSFSYAAVYDEDPLPKALVAEAFARAGIIGGTDAAYAGLREDITPAQAKQMIFWISQGFLEEKRRMGLEPEQLRQEFSEWIDVMERLMTRKEGEA